MDPHGSYHPPEAIRDEFPLDGFGEARRVPFVEGNSGRGGVPGYQRRGFRRAPTDARDYLARYAAEVRFLDQEVGRLLAGLRERRLLESRVLVITADNG